ncbi:cytidine deaminase [Chthonomonas calidirosea]|uniref:Cytidine deaminase n=1 Tax=Chthonomonas calidirosea (strain DSM 23976 / ICMP 18418 / T49) TaxID=1303518 RepID=S0EZE5_CHTCT|nr:cytidine deaminase [Chthonomonas calidirosea]CCW35727.1 cytidine deaminase [Chthonomonas calidirosea T49]CEK18410.1 cytidine deaminase [Chthonomonas calidirosea]CEK19418.1 cytidine deaminase [Chthonomonas calidirosea]
MRTISEAMNVAGLFSEEELSLLAAARQAAKRAHCPYSHFAVGAALETDIGIVLGCNVENASYGLSCCAERVALFTAVAQGATRFLRLALSCPATAPDAPVESRMPCGACLQVLSEFLPLETPLLIDGVGKKQLKELLPYPFR